MGKIHDIEKQTWAAELADMRRMVEDEVMVMRRMAGLIPGHPRPNSRTSWTSDADGDDSFVDVESLKLRLDFDNFDSSSPVPDVYFNHSMHGDELDASDVMFR
jgi:hypothetical protein